MSVVFITKLLIKNKTYSLCYQKLNLNEEKRFSSQLNTSGYRLTLDEHFTHLTNVLIFFIN